jgi:AcrR family transcriptional regulator
MAAASNRPSRSAALRPAERPPAEKPAAGVRRRADAERSIAAILDAGLETLSRNPEVNVAEVARAAGVGRVTLYGHFPSREALVDAIVGHAIARANEALDAVDLEEGSALSALTRLIGSSWHILDQHRQLMVAGMRHLGQNRMRAHHDPAMTRVERLVVRGQADGQIRTDLPRTWLVTTFYTLLHAAAAEVDAGHLDAATAGDVVAATVLAAFTPPRP